MDMFSMMQAVQNPRQVIMQAMFQSMASAHPNEWAQCQKMFQGKTREQQVSELRALYKSKNMDLDSMAKQYGVAL